MELRQLLTFRTVAAMLSFSRASVFLNYVPSNISMQIQALEEELGVRLFDRLGKHVALTDAGQRFLTHVEKALASLDEARDAVGEEQQLSGTVTISAPEVLCAYRLPPILSQFRARYPGIRLIFRPTPYQNLKQSVYDGRTDVVFLLDEPIRSSELQVEAFNVEPLCVLVAPDHPLVRNAPVAIHEWRRELFLLPERGCTYRILFERALARVGIDKMTELEFNSVEAIKQCAIAGMGIATLPAIAVTSELEQGKLIALPWESADMHVMTQMLWHKEKWLSPAITAFLSVARDVLTAR